MTYICYRGIEVSARLQNVLLGIELIMLVVFAVVALVKVDTGNAADRLACTRRCRGCQPVRHSTRSARSSDGLLLVVFIYWGWDTAVAVNEETEDPATTPGPRRDPLHRPAAGHLRARHRRHGRLRRRRRRRASGWATTTTPTTCFAVHRPAPCSATARLGTIIVQLLLIIMVLTSAVGVHPDDDPADRAHHPVDGAPTRRSRSRSPGSTRGT